MRLDLKLLPAFLAAGATIASFGDAHGAWPLDGTSVCRLNATQQTPTTIPDGAGGAFIAWEDGRNGSSDIYAQRVDRFGNPVWTVNGVVLCSAGNLQIAPIIISDGAAGAIVAWQDRRNGGFSDVYAQRVNASGVAQWTTNGVPLCTAPSHQYLSTVVSDDAGGAIVAWYDLRGGSTYDIYAQRVSASGVPLWTTDGVSVCTAAFDQLAPRMASDGAGGAIVTWYDRRAGGQYDIYAQRVNAAGARLWTTDGVILCAAASGQEDPTIVSDGAGGAIVVWEDQRTGAWAIYAQRMNASGTVQWYADGIPICSIGVVQTSAPAAVADGAGGAIVVWRDYRNDGLYGDLYQQRVDASGVNLWGFAGTALCTAPYEQQRATLVPDGAGGAIVTWEDSRDQVVRSDVYAQRLNSLGIAQWTANGVAVCALDPADHRAPAIALDGAGGAIVAWQDNRNGTLDIYAQRVDVEHGFYGHPDPLIVSVVDAPSDQGGHVVLNWKASDHDAHPEQVIAYYSVWRAVDVALLGSAATACDLNLIDPTFVTPDFQGPAYRVREGSSSGYYWEFVRTVTARYSSGYSDTTPTREDSTSSHTATHFFQVLAHTSNTYVFYPSNIVTGHSVDNVAPVAPFLLTALRVGPDVNLRWNRAVAPDLRDYSIYRATSTGVTPVPINFLSSSDDTVAVDASAPTSALYYIVTAFDVHENQSAPSNEAAAGALTSVGNTPPISALTVLDNMPNPFTGTTTLRVGLPKASEVEIEVFDVAGRSVRSEHTASLAAGWREISFDARDGAGVTLPSGVYFYRVRAAGQTLTRKMVIAR